MKTEKLDIQGMNCGGCIRHVTEALRSIRGVQVVSVTIGSAEVSIDPAEVKLDTITSVLTAAGYPAKARAEEKKNPQGVGLPVQHGKCCRE